MGRGWGWVTIYRSIWTFQWRSPGGKVHGSAATSVQEACIGLDGESLVMYSGVGMTAAGFFRWWVKQRTRSREEGRREGGYGECPGSGCGLRGPGYPSEQVRLPPPAPTFAIEVRALAPQLASSMPPPRQ